MDLLERERPMTILGDRWHRVADAHGHIVAISGEAGVGKTTLVTRFLQELGGDDRVFHGACEDFSIAEPLGPLRDIAWQADWVFPDGITESGSTRSVSADAVRALTAVPGRTLILIEDLHWADDATLDFLRYLGRRIRDLKLLLIVTSGTMRTKAVLK